MECKTDDDEGGSAIQARYASVATPFTAVTDLHHAADGCTKAASNQIAPTWRHSSNRFTSTTATVKCTNWNASDHDAAGTRLGERSSTDPV